MPRPKKLSGKTLGQRVTQACEGTGRKQYELAAEMGLTQSRLSNIQRDMAADFIRECAVLRSISDVTGESLDDLVGHGA